MTKYTNEVGETLRRKTTRYEIRSMGKKPEDIVVDVAPWRRDSYTFETREEAEAEAAILRKRRIRNTKNRKKTATARAERIKKLKEYDAWVPGISCILDRVKNEEVDAILDGLDHMLGSITS